METVAHIHLYIKYLSETFIDWEMKGCVMYIALINGSGWFRKFDQVGIAAIQWTFLSIITKLKSVKEIEE